MTTITLNADWQISADPYQWVLEHRSRKAKSGGWRAEKFCVSRDGLLLSIRQMAIQAEPESMAQIAQLPSFRRELA